MADETDSHFGDWLKRQIEDRIMSQTAFADAAGIPRPSLARWIGLKRPPIRGINIARLSRALGVNREVVEGKLAEAGGIESAHAA